MLIETSRPESKVLLMFPTQSLLTESCWIQQLPPVLIHIERPILLTKLHNLPVTRSLPVVLDMPNLLRAKQV